MPTEPIVEASAGEPLRVVRPQVDGWVYPHAHAGKTLWILTGRSEGLGPPSPVAVPFTIPGESDPPARSRMSEQECRERAETLADRIGWTYRSDIIGFAVAFARSCNFLEEK